MSDHTSLRLWLRLLTCTRLIENQVRGKLRETFETTLPRFDLMAQLYRHPEGLRMGEISQLLMVTSGNITGITDQLEKEGFVERVTDPNDRRVWKVHLTPAGHTAFQDMAGLHEAWINDLIGGLTPDEQQQFYDLLQKLRQSLQEKMLQ